MTRPLLFLTRVIKFPRLPPRAPTPGLMWLALGLLANVPWVAPTQATNEAPDDWIFKTPEPSDSTPAIGADGTIYYGSFFGKLSAVNPDGTKKWVFQAGREIKSSPAVGADGTIYFGSRDWKFYAVRPDGNKKWEFKTGAWVDSSPALAPDGTICFGSWDRNFYALNPDGAKLWQFATGGPVVSSPAIGTNGVIYFGSHDKIFYALSPDGKKLWQFQTGGPIVSSPALDWDGNIYFTSGDGFLYVLRSDGSVRWKLQTNSFREGSPVIGTNGMIFQCATDGLRAITPDGREKWYRGKDDMDGTAAVTADGGVIFVFRGGQIVNYSQEREHKWITYYGPTGSASPAVGASGTVYLPGEVSHGMVAIHGNSPLARTPWPKFRGNARNTGNLNDSPR